MEIEKLKLWRKENGLTQRKMADKLGCSERYYQGIESGEYKPSAILEKLIGIITKED